MTKDAFAALGIDASKPGFDLDPAFRAQEEKNAAFLNEYSHYIMSMQFDAEYLSRAAEVIKHCATVLYEALKAEGRKGACIDIANALSRVLDATGIWSCVITGGLTLTFKPSTRLEESFYWVVNEGNFQAPHAWLYAPPFKLVDLAVSLQPYPPRYTDFLPPYVLQRVTGRTQVRPQDLINLRLFPREAPPADILRQYFEQSPNEAKYFNAVGPQRVATDHGELRYFPIRGGGCDGDISAFTALTFSGATLQQLYDAKIRDQVKNLQTT